MNIPGFAHWTLTVALVASHGAVSAQTRPYPPTAQVGGQTLQLNGAGTRYRAVFAVYDVGLYVGRKVTTAEQVLSQPGPKRMAFVALRDTPADQLGLMLVRGMKANAPPQQAAGVAGKSAGVQVGGNGGSRCGARGCRGCHWGHTANELSRGQERSPPSSVWATAWTFAARHPKPAGCPCTCHPRRTAHEPSPELVAPPRGG